MKNNLIIIKCILLIFLFGCSTLGTKEMSRTDASNEIYSIFCNYFADKLAENEIETFILSEKTGVDEETVDIQNDNESKSFFSYMPLINASIFNELLSLNKSSLSISPFPIKKRLIILTEEEEEEIFNSEGWDGFYKKYKSSQGIMTLSRIVYTENKKVAILSFENSCGMKCAIGGLAFFRFIDEKWNLEFIFPIWFS
jgi:hypothetical protein